MPGRLAAAALVAFEGAGVAGPVGQMSPEPEAALLAAANSSLAAGDAMGIGVSVGSWCQFA